MLQSVSLPLWLVVSISALALWAAVDRLLAPGVRWFVHRRGNRVIDQLNRRLRLQIPPLARTRRQALVDRLVYDPKILAEVERYAQAEQIPLDVAAAQVRRYAREVAPAFNAFVYFRVASWTSRLLLERLFRVRLGYADQALLGGIDPNASVVLVMNHRSNLDYVLVTYLVLERAVLSYAVGEWARVWPLQQLVRALGAYFVRRDSGNPLYRRVLERYVQIAVDGGITQAIFPEGGLSRDGKLREARIGLLDYMLRDFDPAGERDIVFVPVGINYDRVLEDRTLLLGNSAKNAAKAERNSGSAALKTALAILLRGAQLKLRGKFYRFGYASANFGHPLSLRAYARERGWQPAAQSRAERIGDVTLLAEHLMGRIGDLVPVLPVATVAALLLQDPQRWCSRATLESRVRHIESALAPGAAPLRLPRDDVGYFVETGLRMLTLRKLVEERDDRYRPLPGETELLAYYANSLAERSPFDKADNPAQQVGGARPDTAGHTLV